MIFKIIVHRTTFDPYAPRIKDIYQTVRNILDEKLEKVILHPNDLNRVFNALNYFIKEIEPQYKLSKL